MHNLSPHQQPVIQRAFQNYESLVRIQNYKVVTILALVFMIAGATLDLMVYPRHARNFFLLRLLCAALLFFIWWFVGTPLGSRYYRILGQVLPIVPSFFMSAMIYATEGPASPYYAGLNLVLVGAGIFLRWTVWDSILVCFEVLVLYLGACLLHGLTGNTGIFYNNSYFIFVTGVFVICGSYLYNRIRFREFALRYELDQKKKMIEESNEKLIQLDQAKSRFFANISHELRTPLTLLLAPLETLINRYKHAFDEKTRELLDVMHANSMRLLRLINDLLDLVRMESGSMQLRKEPLDIADFAKGLASAVRQVADDKHIRLETTIDPQLGLVMVDRDKLEKVVLNLIFNALKFTPAGGRVEFRAEKQGPEIVLQVADTGMGISAKNLSHLFSRFWQADDSSRRKFQGVGIGLALVKELTEVHGGHVSAQSEEGKGTTFTIRLPFEAAPPSAHEAKLEQELVAKSTPQSNGTVTSEEWLANLYRRAELFPAMTAVKDAMRPIETARHGHLPKVLIADDEPDMLRFLKSQLTGNFEVFEAVDGLQAVEKATQFLPDVILVDMMMPEKDGLQVCRELRERTSTQSIPIILLTARADEETKLAALSAGASDFLPKPFSTTELHVRLKNLVSSYDYQRKLAKQNHALENTIDQLKETESLLVQTEKLASLGRLSAGIIHEINNPLNFATTGLFTLRNKAKFLPAEQQGEYAEILQDVEDGLSRVKCIVSDLRSFSHHENEHAEPVNVSEALNSALRFLSHEWKNKVQIQQDVPPTQTIWANKNKLIQVFVNLLQNSIDALKNKHFESGQATIRLEGRVENGVSALGFRDNGEGIPPEVLDKIFEPFFTTKDVGQGMGLGLSICYRIVQSFEGTIRVKSERGQFCEFTLEFPVKQTEAIAA